VLGRVEAFPEAFLHMVLQCGLFCALMALMLFMFFFARVGTGQGVEIMLMPVEGCTVDEAMALAVLGMDVDQGADVHLVVRLASQHRDERGRRTLDPWNPSSFGQTVMVIDEQQHVAFACTLSVNRRHTPLSFADDWCLSAFRFPLPADADVMRAAWLIWQQTIRCSVSDDRRWQSERTLWI